MFFVINYMWGTACGVLSIHGMVLCIWQQAFCIGHQVHGMLFVPRVLFCYSINRRLLHACICQINYMWGTACGVLSIHGMVLCIWQQAFCIGHQVHGMLFVPRVLFCYSINRRLLHACICQTPTTRLVPHPQPRPATPPVDDTDTRSKSEGPKAFSTSRSFCREALAAAVACARTLIGRAGAPIVAEKPRWFLGEFVVKMASPMLLGDAVKALRAAASVLPSSEELQAPGLEEREREGERAGRALREVVLPGTVERLSKVSWEKVCLRCSFVCVFVCALHLNPCSPGLFTDQEAFDISRVGSGRVGSVQEAVDISRVGSGWFGSGQEGFEFSPVGSGWVGPGSVRNLTGRVGSDGPT